MKLTFGATFERLRIDRIGTLLCSKYTHNKVMKNRSEYHAMEGQMYNFIFAKYKYAEFFLKRAYKFDSRYLRFCGNHPDFLFSNVSYVSLEYTVQFLRIFSDPILHNVLKCVA